MPDPWRASIEAASQARRHGLHTEAALIEVCTRQFGEPELGRNRAVFDRGDGFVIKIAVSEDGLSDNLLEARHTAPVIPLARCHFEMMGDCEVLIMERVTVWLGGRSALPDWVDWVDCAQVGHTVDGRLVAFDL